MDSVIAAPSNRTEKEMLEVLLSNIGVIHFGVMTTGKKTHSFSSLGLISFNKYLPLNLNHVRIYLCPTSAPISDCHCLHNTKFLPLFVPGNEIQKGDPFYYTSIFGFPSLHKILLKQERVSGFKQFALGSKSQLYEYEPLHMKPFLMA